MDFITFWQKNGVYHEFVEVVEGLYQRKTTFYAEKLRYFNRGIAVTGHMGERTTFEALKKLKLVDYIRIWTTNTLYIRHF